MTEAASLLVQRLEQEQTQAKPLATATAAPSDPLLGIWRDAPEEIDEIVAEAMQRRRDEPCGLSPVNKSLLDTDIFSEIGKGIDKTVARNAAAYTSAPSAATRCRPLPSWKSSGAWRNGRASAG